MIKTNPRTPEVTVARIVQEPRPGSPQPTSVQVEPKAQSKAKSESGVLFGSKNLGVSRCSSSLRKELFNYAILRRSPYDGPYALTLRFLIEIQVMDGGEATPPPLAAPSYHTNMSILSRAYPDYLIAYT